ncbi:MAG: SRPBCC family protein [Planctomycetota bacterium]
MISLTHTAEIAADRDAVFAAVTDLDRVADFVPAVEKIERLTDGPVGVGTRFRETRQVFGRSATEEFTVVACEPPRTYAVAALSCGARYETTFTFADAGPDTAATTLTVRTVIRPETWGARLASPLAWLTGGAMKRAIAADVEAIAAEAVARHDAVLPPRSAADA